MEFMGWVSVLLALMGLALAGMGVRILVTGSAPRWFAPDAEPGRAGRYSVLAGLSFLLMAGGSLGERLGLFGGLVHLMLTIAGFAFLITAIVRYRPRRVRPEAPKG